MRFLSYFLSLPFDRRLWRAPLLGNLYEPEANYILYRFAVNLPKAAACSTAR